MHFSLVQLFSEKSIISGVVRGAEERFANTMVTSATGKNSIKNLE